MKHIEDLYRAIETISFFSNIGKAEASEKIVALKSLSAWGGENPSQFEIEISESMDWLPTSRDQIDPFESQSQNDNLNSKKVRLEVTKMVMSQLRGMDVILKAGPNDFIEAAKGGAIYTFRKAADELTAKSSSIWCDLSQIYAKGHWPLGRTNDGKIVVL